ncbi:MAG: adenosine kinase [Caulobacter sp.]|nr:adenosine kinase [Caulobacter sp.]
MPELYDVAAIGNAIVDVIAPCDDAFLAAQGLVKNSMQLIDEDQAEELYGHMAPGIETSGGSGGNTVAGVASLGGRAAFLGKVADDQLGEVYEHDMHAIGVAFDSRPLTGGPRTAHSLINVTPDGHRTMCTFLGASTELGPDDIDPLMIESAKIIFLEGYLFDPPEARRAFAKAAGLSRAAGRLMSITLSDSFVVERHRDVLLAFIETECDIVLANEAEVKAMFQTDDFEAASQALVDRTRICAITRGEAGSMVFAGGTSHVIPAYPVEKVVDTTGAGDQYAAGFLLGLARGRSMDVCGRLGALAAAEVISHYGPRPQVSLEALAKAEGLF